jgi:hypothetical protein
MSRRLAWLAPYETRLPTIFAEHMNQVRGLPIGSERLLWNRKAIEEKDIELEATNHQFRNEIFDTCWTIIDRFGESAPQATCTVNLKWFLMTITARRGHDQHRQIVITLFQYPLLDQESSLT